jgi:uncharacterized membrane protein
MKEDPVYAEIRRSITKRYANRTEFFGHLVAFIAINLLGWLILRPTEGIGLIIMLLASGGWLAGLLIHMVNFIMTEGRERAIEVAIDRERARRGEAPLAEYKRKRDRLTLTDDGEVLEVIEDDDEPALDRHSNSS